MKEFTKKDLKNYMRVVLNNGDTCVVVEDTIMNVNLGDYEYLDFYSSDLKYLASKSYEKERLDIVAVYPPKIQDEICIDDDDTPIWYKKAVKEFSQDELIILRNLDKKYNYISRALDGNMVVFENCPTKHGSGEFWAYYGCGTNIRVFDNIFQQIKWEDDEPVRIDDYVERS